MNKEKYIHQDMGTCKVGSLAIGTFFKVKTNDKFDRYYHGSISKHHTNGATEESWLVTYVEVSTKMRMLIGSNQEVILYNPKYMDKLEMLPFTT